MKERKKKIGCEREKKKLKIEYVKSIDRKEKEKEASKGEVRGGG